MSTMRVNVDSEGLERARSALNQAEELTQEGFEHVDEVLSRVRAAVDGAEEYGAAVRSAVESHIN